MAHGDGTLLGRELIEGEIETGFDEGLEAGGKFGVDKDAVHAGGVFHAGHELLLLVVVEGEVVVQGGDFLVDEGAQRAGEVGVDGGG